MPMPNFDWFSTLTKPRFSPPDWVFTPVWSILYVMILLSLIFFMRTGNLKNKKLPLLLFLIQLVLNLAWSPIFFGAQNIELALIVIILLWLSLLATIIKFYPHSKTSAILLIPYFLWVSFATYLNIEYVRLN